MGFDRDGSTARFKWKGGAERHTRREYISPVGIFLESIGKGQERNFRGLCSLQVYILHIEHQGWNIKDLLGVDSR